MKKRIVFELVAGILMLVSALYTYVPKSQYESEEYQYAIVEDITDNWLTLSRNNKFHAIFATSSIPEAFRYYKKFKEIKPELRVTCLFVPSMYNGGD